MSDPIPEYCDRCDFSSGQRGMDRCAECDGTGSIFRVKGKTFPNTLAGYAWALAAMEEDK